MEEPLALLTKNDVSLPYVKKTVMIWTVVVGIVAGAVACLIMGRERQGCLVNLLLGLAGGFVGGNALGWISVEWHGVTGQIGTSVVGAVIILWLCAKLKR